MKSTFLKAEWRKLILANYVVGPDFLKPFLPEGVELDLWNNRCYLSLVGFMFLNTRVKGVAVPFHQNFEEINLRFYVKHFDEGKGWKRGVVFIKEIVPKPAITAVARTVYGEPYETLKMKHDWKSDEEFINVNYACYKTKWQNMQVKALNQAVSFLPGSEEEFITEHYWGYTKQNTGNTQEYGVEHPSWKVYPVTDFACDFDFGDMYGGKFDFLNNQHPASVFLAEGSEIVVKSGKPLALAQTHKV
ncbi:MAG: DUF2071 domain-containing protein [Bacteroidia bacterium]|nr:DUF2071 domain-containing protein [Bacteroidia bacterium]